MNTIPEPTNALYHFDVV